MVNRMISADENNNVPDSLNIRDVNLPNRLQPGELNATYVPAFPESQAITYNGDGSVATVTENGVLTSYTYNSDGTVATDTRAGVTRNYIYTGGNLTGIEAV